MVKGRFGRINSCIQGKELKQGRPTCQNNGLKEGGATEKRQGEGEGERSCLHRFSKVSRVSAASAESCRGVQVQILTEVAEDPVE